MLFNSYIFIFAFLPPVILLWWGLRDTRYRLLSLTLTSYIFYGWWSWRYLPLMLISTGVDYIAGAKIESSSGQQRKRFWLASSLTANLLLLAFFKYSDFIANSLNVVLRKAGSNHSLPLLGLTLPIGISFYTFNSMSYTIDLYRGLVRKARSLLHYTAFVAMFPHLIAGPIVRYSDIEKQFERMKEHLSWEQGSMGVFFFVVGLAKKVIIADRLAVPASDFFGNPYHAGALHAWLGVLCYTFQLYFDFSGYSDMAVGLAHLLGIQFPKNFDSPYKAVNIGDFWRRWHISLSSWLRDYLFIPLGGSSGSMTRTASNLFITMFLGGLWHGAHWTFVVWGLYHGVLLAGYRVAGVKFSSVIPLPLARLITFGFVTIGWVFFRASCLSEALSIIREMFSTNGIGIAGINSRQAAMLALAIALSQLSVNTFQFRLRPRSELAYGLAVLVVLCLSLMGQSSPFLYFQF